MIPVSMKRTTGHVNNLPVAFRNKLKTRRKTNQTANLNQQKERIFPTLLVIW